MPGCRKSEVIFYMTHGLRRRSYLGVTDAQRELSPSVPERLQAVKPGMMQ